MRVRAARTDLGAGTRGTAGGAGDGTVDQGFEKFAELNDLLLTAAPPLSKTRGWRSGLPANPAERPRKIVLARKILVTVPATPEAMGPLTECAPEVSRTTTTSLRSANSL